MAEVWPWQVPIAPSFRKSNASVSGGRTLTGDEFVVRGDAGFWRATASVVVHREKSVVAYQALIAALDGAAGQVLIPVYSRWRPRDYNGRMRSAAKANGIDGDPLLDHGGLSFEETPMMWVTTGGMRRATRIMISHPHVDSIRPGHYFGIGERLYIVARQWQVSSETITANTGGELYYGDDVLLYGTDVVSYGEASAPVIEGENTSVIEFWPPLRDGVAGGTPLILGRPVCRMRLSSDETGALDLGWSRSAQVSLDLEEVF